MTNATTSTTNPTTPVPADAEQISANILQVTVKTGGRTKVQGRGRVAEILSPEHQSALLGTLQDEDSEVDAFGNKAQRAKFQRMARSWAESQNLVCRFVQERDNTDESGVVHAYLEPEKA